MKKIMFNDRYRLTRAVIEGRKTMTRRVCKDYATGNVIYGDLLESWLYYPDEGLAEFLMKDGSVMVAKAPYREGEVVAVAQNYNDALEEYNRMGDTVGWGALVGTTENGCAGYGNKMFVKSEVMPHRIEMTGMKIERITSISEKDCFREGITKGRVPGMYTFENTGKLWCNPKMAFSRLFVNVSYSRREALIALKRDAVVWAYVFEMKTGE
jgi:hypothetical protein